jgi:hypothetical protein
MRYFALTNYLAASLATSPADSLHSLHSSQGTARVQKLRSAVMRAPIVESSMSTPSPVSTSTSTDEPSTRRRALQSILVGGSVAFMGPVGARALDMDAFMNSQVRHTSRYNYIMSSSKLMHVTSIRSRTYTRTHSLSLPLIISARSGYQKLRSKTGSQMHSRAQLGRSLVQVRTEWNSSG